MSGPNVKCSAPVKVNESCLYARDIRKSSLLACKFEVIKA